MPPERPMHTRAQHKRAEFYPQVARELLNEAVDYSGMLKIHIHAYVALKTGQPTLDGLEQ